MSVISTAVLAIVNKLGAVPPVSSQIDRIRLRPLARSSDSAIVVRLLRAEATDLIELASAGPSVWDITVAIECYARASAGTAPDAAVDTLLSAVYARLMNDTTLGNQVNHIEAQSIAYDFDADDQQTACATLQMNVRQIATTLSL